MLSTTISIEDSGPGGGLGPDFGPHQRSAFVPVCLYSKALITRRGFASALAQVDWMAESVLVLIADDLHAYGMISRGSRQETALRGARRLGESLRAMILGVAAKAQGMRVRVMVWRELAGAPGFQAIASRIERAWSADPAFRAHCQAYVDYSIRRFGWTRSEASYRWERRYLLEELSASIVATEVLGYSLEVWEAEPATQGPDPLGYLYGERPELLRDILAGRASMRRFCLLPAGGSRVAELGPCPVDSIWGTGPRGAKTYGCYRWPQSPRVDARPWTRPPTPGPNQ